MTNMLTDTEEFVASFLDSDVHFHATRLHREGLVVEEHEGLLGGVEFDSDSQPRYDGLGDFESVSRPRPRKIVLSGHAWQPDPVDMRTLEQQFTGLLLEGYAWLTVKEYGRTRRLKVKRRGKWEFTRVGRTGYALWQAEFEASDPRYYGITERVSDTGALVNVGHRGNYRSYPTNVRVNALSGFSDGYRLRLLTLGGETLGTLDMAPLSVGVVDNINFRTGVARRASVDYGLIVGGRVFYIPPNGRFQLRIGGISDIGAGELTATYEDVWL